MLNSFDASNSAFYSLWDKISLCAWVSLTIWQIRMISMVTACFRFRSMSSALYRFCREYWKEGGWLCQYIYSAGAGNIQGWNPELVKLKATDFVWLLPNVVLVVCDVCGRYKIKVSSFNGVPSSVFLETSDCGEICCPICIAVLTCTVHR